MPLSGPTRSVLYLVSRPRAPLRSVRAACELRFPGAGAVESALIIALFREFTNESVRANGNPKNADAAVVQTGADFNANSVLLK